MTETIESGPFIVGKEAMKEFVLGSNGSRNWRSGLFTLTNTKAGTHKTFTVQRKDSETPMWFVRYLGGDNNACPDNYYYLGLIKGFAGDPVFKGTTASPGDGTSMFVAFNWFFNDVLMGSRKVPEALAMNHEGYCSRCGRLLTVGASVSRGFGPKCYGNMQ